MVISFSLIFSLRIGNGVKIPASLHEKFKTDLNDKLYVIGSDGTAPVIGALNGGISSLEEFLSRPLQYTICLLCVAASTTYS